MISDWKILSLGEIADIKRGLPSQDLNYVESDSDGVRLIRINDFKSDSPKFIKETDKTKKLTLKKGDVLIAGTGATAGISFLVNDLWHGLPFSYNAPRIRVKKENSSTFVYFILNSEKIKRQQNKLFTGNAQPFLDTRAIASFNIPVPPLAEQQKIAEILSTIDDKIEVINQQIIETQALKKGLMQRLLTKGIGHTEFKDSPLGEIPKSWEVVRSSDVFELIHGYQFRDYDFTETGLPIVKIGQINKNGEIDMSGCSFFSSDRATEFSEKRIFNGDVLMALTGATLGKSCWVDGLDSPVYQNYRVGKFVPHDERVLSKQFLYFLVGSPLALDQIMSKINSGAQGNVGKSDFEKLKIPLPPIVEQLRITNVLSLVDEKCRVLSEKKIHYQELKEGLMQQLLTGKIRVKV